jgi:hypothetical protein
MKHLSRALQISSCGARHPIDYQNPTSLRSLIRRSRDSPRDGSSILTLVADIIIFFGIYITLTPLVRAITGSDLDLVELTLSEPAYREIASPFLLYERWLVGFGTEGGQ